MKDHTAMPIITFGKWTDYTSVRALIHFAGVGVGYKPEYVMSGEEGFVFAFHLDDEGPALTGRLVGGCEGNDFAVRIDGTDEVITFDADMLTEVEYL